MNMMQRENNRLRCCDTEPDLTCLSLADPACSWYC